MCYCEKVFFKVLGALALAFCCLGLPLERVCADQSVVNWGSGPVSLKNQYFPATMHLSWSPQSPELLEVGATGLDLSLAWTNGYILEKRYEIDAETLIARLSLSHAFSDNFELGVELPLQWRGGGVLDSAIENWHETFGLPEGNREFEENGDFRVAGLKGDGSIFDLNQDGSGLSNLVLKAKYLLSVGTKTAPAWGLEFQSSLPTASSGFGHKGVDFLLGALSSKRWGAFSLYAGASFLYYSEDQYSGLSYSKYRWEAFLSSEYSFSQSWSANLGFYGGSSVLDNLPGHPAGMLYLDIALRYAMTQRHLVSLAMRENPRSGAGSADFSMLVAWETVFGTDS